MPRTDLLALTHEDLAALSNRGTVKRAVRELDENTLSCTIIDKDSLTVDWSDGTSCIFPAGKTLKDAVCSSGMLGITRHVIRSVLAYQRKVQTACQTTDLQVASSGKTISATEPASAETTWNPGEISDDELIAHFQRAAISRARKAFDQGVLVELTRGTKPTARFLHESCTVRFPVPHDIRYAIADCSEGMLPQWVALAVWSYRQLTPDRKAGLVSLGQTDQVIPEAQIARLHSLLQQWFAEGFAGLPSTWSQRFARLEAQMRTAGMIWPAELMLDIMTQQRRYSEHDARFSATESLRNVGELVARLRAIQNPTSTLPQAMVRGNKSDRKSDIKAGRFIGVGMQVHLLQKQTRLLAYFQDNTSGTLLAIARTLVDPENAAEPPPLESLAEHSLARGVSIGAAATSQLVLAGGKRTATNVLILPRSGPANNKLAIHPQSFQWEYLLPPLALDDFAQCQQRLAQMPPDYLRPKRFTEDLQVFPITAITEVRFDSIEQQLVGTIHDTTGAPAALRLPFYSRAETAFDAFVHTLQTNGNAACFISGHVRLNQQRLEIRPLAVVIQSSTDHRVCITPWTSDADITETSNASATVCEAAVESLIDEFFKELNTQLADILIMGLARANTATLRLLIDSAYRAGFVRLTTQLEILVQQLEERQDNLNWTSTQAGAAYAQLALLCRMRD